VGDDDFIAGLQTSVMLEVVEKYLRERRIIEEEIGLVFEASTKYHQMVAVWRKNRDLMVTALLNEEIAEKFNALTGLAPYQNCVCFDDCRFPKPDWVLTRLGRYRRLIEGLYEQIYKLALDADKARKRLCRLRDEVNDDIRRFELDHDLLALNQYLRSMNPEYLRKRKMLGTNFTAFESAHAANALSFRPIALEILALEHQVDPLLPPQKAFPKIKPLLKEICRKSPKEVDMLFIQA
jgi:hypothetical protein